MNSVKLLLTFVIFSQFSDQGTASFADDYGDYEDYFGDYADYSGAVAGQTCGNAKFSLKNNFWKWTSL